MGRRGALQAASARWWETDLIDEAGGGDFLARLLPQTHKWAALEAVREAARRTDAKACAKMADPDKMRTLFFLGFEVDEQLGDRFAAGKRSGLFPADALPLPLPLTAEVLEGQARGGVPRRRRGVHQGAERPAA